MNNPPLIEEVLPKPAGQSGIGILLKAGTVQVDDSQANESAKTSSIASHVLLGRGKGYAQNPGNQRMRRIVNRYKNRYLHSSRAVRRKLRKQAHEEIVEGGVMFLKQVGNGSDWAEVDAEVAIEKVAHALRCRKDYNFNVQESTTKSIVGSSAQITIPTLDGANIQPDRPQERVGHQEIFKRNETESPTILQQLEGEVLRRAIVEQRALDAAHSLRTRSLLIQQLQAERLRTRALIQSLASVQPQAVSALELQSPQSVEQGQTLRRILASRGSIFPGRL